MRSVSSHWRALMARARAAPATFWGVCAVLVLVLGFGLFARFRNIDNALPYPGHWDEEPISAVPYRMLQDRTPNPRWFRYPSGPFNLMAGALWLGLAVEARGLDDAARLGRQVDADGYQRFPAVAAYPRRLLALLSVVALGALSLTAYLVRRQHALLVTAPLIAMGSAIYFRLSWKYLNVDIVGACFAMLTVAHLAFWRAQGERASFRRHAVISGLLAGFAVGCKYNLAPIALPCLLQVFFISSRRELLLRVPVLGVSGLAGFLISTPYALLDHRRFVKGLFWQVHHYGTGHGEFSIRPGWPAFARYSGDLAEDLGTPTLLLAAGGIVWMLATDRKLAAVILAFPLSFIALMSTQRVYFVRNAVSMPLFIALFAALGLAALSDLVSRLAPRSPFLASRPRVAAYGGVALAAGVLFIALYPRSWSTIYQPDVESRNVAARFILERYPPNARIVVDKSLRIDPRTFGSRPVSQRNLCGRDGPDKEEIRHRYGGSIAVLNPVGKGACSALSRRGKLKVGSNRIEKTDPFVVDPKLAVVPL